MGNHNNERPFMPKVGTEPLNKGKQEQFKISQLHAWTKKESNYGKDDNVLRSTKLNLMAFKFCIFTRKYFFNENINQDIATNSQQCKNI